MVKTSSFFKKIILQNLERKVRSFRDRYLRKYDEVSLPAEVYDQEKMYSISLCTTCMNRLFHLKHTIEKNILDNVNYPDIEFVLIDYNSKDGLQDYVKLRLKKYIDQGKLSYYKTSQPEKFHASKAKNLAHSLAKGEIVCNLDGDNFTGKDFAFYLNYLYNRKDKDKIYQFHKAPFWGTVGRLALWKEDFMNLGGYDESLLPIGHEDMDLVDRGGAYGLEFEKIEIENFQRYLSNTTLEKSVNCAGDANYYELEQLNREISSRNIENGVLKANVDGMENFILYKNFNTNPSNSSDLIKISKTHQRKLNR